MKLNLFLYICNVVLLNKVIPTNTISAAVLKNMNKFPTAVFPNKYDIGISTKGSYSLSSSFDVNDGGRDHSISDHNRFLEIEARRGKGSKDPNMVN